MVMETLTMLLIHCTTNKTDKKFKKTKQHAKIECCIARFNNNPNRMDNYFRADVKFSLRYASFFFLFLIQILILLF